MAEVKYRYDPKTLSYQKIEISAGKKVRRILLYSLFVFFNALLGYVILSRFVDSPKEKALKRELEFLKLNFEILSKKEKQQEARLAELEMRDNSIYRQIFEADPIPDGVRQAGVGGVNRYRNLEGYEYSDLVKDVARQVDDLSNRIVIQSKSFDDIVNLVKNKEEMLASIPAIQPVKKGDKVRISSGFGLRTHPILKIRRMHKGMDFTAPKGTPIYAAGNGVVSEAKRSYSFGNVVKINHGYGYETLYAHMTRFVVRRGQKVKRGDLIGYVGNTGLSVAPHLHYEVHKNGRAVNPVYYFYGDLTPEEFIAVQKIAEQENQSMD